MKSNKGETTMKIRNKYAELLMERERIEGTVRLLANERYDKQKEIRKAKRLLQDLEKEEKKITEDINHHNKQIKKLADVAWKLYCDGLYSARGYSKDMLGGYGKMTAGDVIIWANDIALLDDYHVEIKTLEEARDYLKTQGIRVFSAD